MGIHKTRCSVVLLLRDAYTGLKPAPSSVSLQVEGAHVTKPIVKTGDGLWVFTDLARDPAIITINSPIYSKQVLTINLAELNPLDPLVTVALLPGRSYPLPPDATVLTGRLQSAAGKSLEGIAVRAALCDERGAKARLTTDALPGSTEFETAPILGRISEGDRYEIRSRDGQVLEECEIAGFGTDRRKVKVSNPIQSAVPRGSLLLPIITAICDASGEFRIVFRPPLASSTLKVEVSVNSGQVKHESVHILQAGRNSIQDPIILT
ncbi:hypothetical protein [Paenibacillus sp. CF384]|uniref:hypothetical protein n=1 Tax=Paenibacillus sp. CF384 TaxID=1884382 RepID=UPI00089922FB|nr:hypothetical protein [Paenibacillus sp. CF384]SDW54991.1 hypothetical protein SAMN05518855_100350 [Paenibacillus sp. CF384]